MTENEKMEETREDRKHQYEDRGGDGDGDRPFRRQVKYRKKICKFCHDKEVEKALDYKRIDILERFISNRGKIIPRRITGNCAFHQRAVAREIKKARSICLLPFKVI